MRPSGATAKSKAAGTLMAGAQRSRGVPAFTAAPRRAGAGPVVASLVQALRSSAAAARNGAVVRVRRVKLVRKYVRMRVLDIGVNGEGRAWGRRTYSPWPTR